MQTGSEVKLRYRPGPGSRRNRSSLIVDLNFLMVTSSFNSDNYFGLWEVTLIKT